MVQEIIVIIIGLTVIGTVSYKIYSFFFTKKEMKGSCGCSSCHCNIPEKGK